MKKITQKEFDKMKFLQAHKTNRVLLEIGVLAKGEILFVKKNEWKVKTDLIMGLGNFGRAHKKKFKGKTLFDKSGWVIKRIK